MIEVKVLIVPECSDGDIKHWIQFFSEIENIEKAPHQAMQNDILFYLNSLKYFKDKSEKMQKALQDLVDLMNLTCQLKLNTEYQMAVKALKGAETNGI